MGVITKGGGWWLAYVCLPTQLLCQTLLWKPFESWFPGMQLCLCLPVQHHGCMPSYVWPFQKCVDMFRNKLWDVKITYWVGNKQISPKRTGPLKAMGSSCRGLDVCSGLAAEAKIWKYVFISLSLPHLWWVCGGKVREGEMRSPSTALTSEGLSDYPAVRLLLHPLLSPGMGLHPRTTFLTKSVWFLKLQMLLISSSLSLSKVNVAQCLFWKGGTFLQAFCFFSSGWCCEER